MTTRGEVRGTSRGDESRRRDETTRGETFDSIRFERLHRRRRDWLIDRLIDCERTNERTNERTSEGVRMRRGRWSVEERNATRRAIDRCRTTRANANERTNGRLTSAEARARAQARRGGSRSAPPRRATRGETANARNERRGKEGESAQDDSRVINVPRRARTGTRDWAARERFLTSERETRGRGNAREEGVR